MKKILFIVILAGAFGLKPANGFSQGLLFFHDTLNPHSFFFEAEIGMGTVNQDYGQMCYSFHSGFQNYVLSARFHRSEKGSGFIFENSWLGGYRFKPARNFDATFSAGVDDIAFVSNYDASAQAIDREIAGFMLDAELKYNFSRHGLPSAWSVYANGYVTTNAYKGLKGFSAGIAFIPMNHGPVHWYPTRAEYEKELQYRADAKEKWKKEKREKQAERIESRKDVHWENNVGAGIAEKSAIINLSSFIGFHNFAAGCFFRGGMFRSLDERVPYGSPAPPGVFYVQTIHEKSYEWNPALAYTFYKLEGSLRVWASGGPVFRTTREYIFDNSNFVPHSYYRGSRFRTGGSVQLEADHIGRRRLSGIGFFVYASVFQKYSAAGAGAVFKFGIL